MAAIDINAHRLCRAIMTGVSGSQLAAIVGKLVAKKGKASLNQPLHENGSSAMTMAAEFGRGDVMDILLSAGASADEADPDGLTPLFLASQDGHTHVVQRLIAARANVNRPWSGFTPLFIASQKGFLSTVEALLSGNAHVDTACNAGCTPLLIASQNGHLSVVQRLISVGPRIDHVNKEGRTPLFMACQQGHTAIVDKLISAGAAVCMRDAHGQTPLHMASGDGHSEIVRRLLRAGANIDSKEDRMRCTPLHLAAQNGHEAVVACLIDAGSACDTLNRGGFTPLLSAVFCGRVESALQLLSAGASLDIALACAHKESVGRAVTERLLATAREHFASQTALDLMRVTDPTFSKQRGVPPQERDVHSETMVEVASEMA